MIRSLCARSAPLIRSFATASKSLGAVLNKSMNSALNEQAQREFYASNVYMSASNWFASRNLDGIAKYFADESEEERKHGMKIFDHIIKRDGTCVLGSVKAPPENEEWDSPLAVFKAACDIETEFAKHLSDLVFQARDEKDVMTELLVVELVESQVKAVDQARGLLQQAQSYATMPLMIYHLNQQLKK